MRRLLVLTAIFACRVQGSDKVSLITFLDCRGFEVLALPIRNKVCYARLRGYEYRLKLLQERDTSKITYRKPTVVAEALASADEGSTLIWMDADVVVMQSSRRIESFFDDGSAWLWMTDHNCNPNNGVVAFRSGTQARDFVRSWSTTCRQGDFPFTDQGCYYEQLVKTASNRSLVNECHLLSKRRKRAAPLMKCVMQVWDTVFGSFDATKDRCAGPVCLRHANDGFNNHYCNPKRHQFTYCQWYIPPGWNKALCFSSGMFALHARSPSKADGLGLPQTNFNTASLKDINTSTCVTNRNDDIDRSVKDACASGVDAWITLSIARQ